MFIINPHSYQYDLPTLKMIVPAPLIGIIMLVGDHMPLLRRLRSRFLKHQNFLNLDFVTQLKVEFVLVLLKAKMKSPRQPAHNYGTLHAPQQHFIFNSPRIVRLKKV